MRSQSHEPSWTDNAKCRNVPKNFFYPDDGPGADRAAAYCWGVHDGIECPARMACLRNAIDNNETLGVWGGYGQRDRVRIRRVWQTTGTVRDLMEVKVLLKTPKQRPITETVRRSRVSA